MNFNSTFSRNPRRQMRKVSEKRATENREYLKLRTLFLVKHPRCQWGERDPQGGCKNRSFDLHHKAGRTGRNFLDTKTWMAVCRHHHNAIHNNPNQARKAGLLK